MRLPRPTRLDYALLALAAIALVVDPHAAAGAGGVQVAFFGPIIAGVVAVVSWIADKAVTIAVTIAQAAVMIATAIAHFAVTVAGVFIRVLGLLGRFYSNVLRPFVSWAWRNLERLHSWLQRTLGPVLRFLLELRARIFRLYDKWLKPIFDTIDVTRRILRILATFHVPFAQALDGKLAALEAKLLQPITFALAKINEAVNWINRIIDMNGLFQRVTLIKSLVRDAELAWNVLLGPKVNGLTAEEAEGLRKRAHPADDPRAAGVALGEFYVRGTGRIAGQANELVPTWLTAAGMRSRPL